MTTGISALRAPAITTAEDFCWCCRNRGYFWRDDSGEERACDANHSAAELCHCMVEVTPPCSGCGEVVDLVGVVSEVEGYCNACAFVLSAAVKCQVFDTTGEAVAS